MKFKEVVSSIVIVWGGFLLGIYFVIPWLTLIANAHPVAYLLSIAAAFLILAFSVR